MKHQRMSSSPWSCLAYLAPLLGLLAAGCGAEDDDASLFEAPDDATIAAESQYMANLYHASGQSPMRIDLSDEMQYRFVIHRLLHAGKTLESSPHLFERIDINRRIALGEALPDGVGEAKGALTANPCGHVLPMTEAAAAGGNSTVAGTSQVNCEGGVNYAYTDIIASHALPDGSDHTNVDTVYGEIYAGGENFNTVTTQVTIPASRVFALDSFTYASDDSGRESMTYALNDSYVSNAPPSITVTYPKEMYNDPGTTTDDPDRIRVCIKRGGKDCDFAAVNAAGQAWTQPLAGIGVTKVPPTSPWTADKVWLASGTFDSSHVYIPLVGTLDAGTNSTGQACQIRGFNSQIENNTQSGILAAAAQIALIDTNSGAPGTGRVCQITKNYAANDGGKLLEYLKHRLAFPQAGDVDSKAYFDFLADFGPDCYGYEHRVQMDFSIRVMTTNCSATGGAAVKTATFTVKPIDFKNSCVAEGTRVILNDGRDVSIEQVQVGDRIVAEQGGTMLTVTALTQGFENDPMIRLVDDKGHGLLITAKHPVVTASKGIVAAEELKEGDKVLTDQGEATLTSVAREEHKGRVYNLTVGTSDELATVGPTGRTMFANGFVIGDNAMQSDRSVNPAALMSVDPLSLLPAAWHRDYKASEARDAGAAPDQRHLFLPVGGD